MIEGNAGSTKCFRWLSWMMSVLGHYLLFSPIIKLLAWIPLLGWLFSTIFAWAVGIFAVIWASMLHLAILGIAWIFYRPLFGFLMLLGVASIVVLMNYGDENEYDVSKFVDQW